MLFAQVPRERAHGAVQVRAMCEAAPSALALIGHAESDAWLALGLAVTLSVVPLTLQLSKLSGFLWARTLQVRCSGLQSPISATQRAPRHAHALLACMLASACWRCVAAETRGRS